jgi:esterase
MRVGTTAGHGLRLAYTAWGAPRAGRLPLVLLHGLTGRGADWEPIARRLAHDRRVVALDARGHGASEWSPDAAYAGDAHFADVATALDALGIARCALAGYSMGGGVAILTAGALPERVARLVVVDAYPAPEMTPGSARIARRIARLYGGPPAGTCAAVAPAARPAFDPAIARRIAEELAAGDPRRLDLWPFWEAGRCPALVVRGERSDVLPVGLAREMIARRPAARLATIPDAGHRLPFTRPRQLARLMAAFLAEDDDGAAGDAV